MQSSALATFLAMLISLGSNADQREALGETGNLVYLTEITRYRFTLFDRSGNTVISTAPHKFSTAIHNVCRAVFDQNEKGNAEVGDDEPKLQPTDATPDYAL